MQVLASLLGVVFLALSLVVGLADSVPGDERMLAELTDALGTSLDDAMGAVGAVSNTGPLVAVSAVIAAALLLTGRRQDAAVFLAVVVVGVAGNRVLKEIVGRPRPDVRPHPESVSEYSFPSGHAANTVAVYLGLLQVVRGRPWRGIVLGGGAFVVVVVGFSRLATGVHYPSDILAGWLWVGAWAAMVWSWREPRKSDQQRPR